MAQHFLAALLLHLVRVLLLILGWCLLLNAREAEGHYYSTPGFPIFLQEGRNDGEQILETDQLKYMKQSS